MLSGEGRGVNPPRSAAPPTSSATLRPLVIECGSDGAGEHLQWQWHLAPARAEAPALARVPTGADWPRPPSSLNACLKQTLLSSHALAVKKKPHAKKRAAVKQPTSLWLHPPLHLQPPSALPPQLRCRPPVTLHLCRATNHPTQARTTTRRPPRSRTWRMCRWSRSQGRPWPRWGQR